jgi:hypothetical protein
MTRSLLGRDIPSLASRGLSFDRDLSAPLKREARPVASTGPEPMRQPLRSGDTQSG